jgi:cytochrome c5
MSRKTLFMSRSHVVIAIFAGAVALASSGFARTPEKDAPSHNKETTASPVVVRNGDADSMRIQGEQRFHANCGRCHAAPRKFPPRMMATVIRHMRVRATITDEDMRLVLFYMTQ